MKDTNPKDAIGVRKVPLHLVSPIVKAYQAVAHFLGNVKYGAWNFRAAGARASVYYAAAQRHLDRWWEGQEYDATDKTHHLANALACINILIEAKHSGNLVDDRPPSRWQQLENVYAEVEKQMAGILERYADKAPRHFTIADTLGVSDSDYEVMPADYQPEGYGPPVERPRRKRRPRADILAAKNAGLRPCDCALCLSTKVG